LRHKQHQRNIRIDTLPILEQKLCFKKPFIHKKKTKRVMPDSKFRSFKLQAEMVAAIEQLITDFPECGWKSVADFLRFAVRTNPYWIQSMYFKLVREVGQGIEEAVKDK